MKGPCKDNSSEFSQATNGIKGTMFSIEDFRRLKHPKINPGNLRKYISIKAMHEKAKKVTNEELSEMVNIKTISDFKTENIQRKKKIPEEFCLQNLSSFLNPEDKKAHAEEVSKQYLDICLKRASLIKLLLDNIAKKTRKGLKVKKFRQSDVTVKQRKVVLPRHLSIEYEQTYRAYEISLNHSG